MYRGRAGEAAEPAGQERPRYREANAGSVTMMPYQVFQLYQAERTKTAAEIRRADDRLGELSQALSSAWHHATRPTAVLRALAGAVTGSVLARPAGEHGPARQPQRTQPLALRRADYLTRYHPCFPSGRPSAPCGRPGEGGA
jgi:hypothetical protein